ncbi:hypothetical protein NLU13_6258 [Sarocladium strictum]|uniref:RecA family profile 1 domain-containing protein n=1 Tax=Sarocladium strictum TaxID=5046 RepID=A0AA39GFW8_SARSR|nr:hypothetical protein NLU13_6258 [Sarocladium strictum]
MTDLLAILPSFPTSRFAAILPRIEQHAITTTDLLTLHPADLAKQTTISILDLKRFIAAVQASLADDLGPPTEVSIDGPVQDDDAGGQGSTRLSVVSTLDDDLDAALGGGVPVGCITEFAGESGAGKTQMLLSLCLAVQLPPPRGLSRKALYISTEAALATKRLAQMLESNPVLRLLQEEGSGTCPSLDNILSTVTPDLESQDHILEYQVPVLMERHEIGLLVIDSVAANFRAEFERQGSHGSNMAARSAELVRLGALLRDLARKHNIAVVVANQVADRFASPSTPRVNSSTPRMSQQQHSSFLSQPSPLARRSMPPPGSLPPSSSSMPPPPDSEPPAPPVLHLDHQQRWFTGWGDEPRPGMALKTPSLGLVWSTQIACRIALIKRPVYGRPPAALLAAAAAGDDYDDGGASGEATLRKWRRWMKVVFATHVPASGQGLHGAAEFLVNNGGLKFVPRKDVKKARTS